MGDGGGELVCKQEMSTCIQTKMQQKQKEKDIKRGGGRERERNNGMRDRRWKKTSKHKQNFEEMLLEKKRERER